MTPLGALSLGAADALAAVAVRDVLQREHAVLRNCSLVGHARYLLESIGPEPRQYLVAGDNEERPFTRDQRRWVYASVKGQNNYFGFGTDNDVEYIPGYPVINHSTFAPRGSSFEPARRAGREAAVREGPRCGAPARSGPGRSSTSPR